MNWRASEEGAERGRGMKLKPLIGERQNLRERGVPFRNRLRIYLGVGCGILFVIVSTVIWFATTPAAEIWKLLGEAVLPGIIGVLMLGGLIFWAVRSYRNRER